MTLDTTEATGLEGTRVQRGPRALAALLIALVASALAGAFSVSLGHRFAQSAVVDLGPTDNHYVTGFRDIERDGPAYFRWTSVPLSSLSLPIRLCGSGTLRARVRRHFPDPALLSISVSGAVVGQTSVRAREDHPYEIIQFPISKAACGSNASVLLEASVENDRPLGVALDWLELRGRGLLRAAPETVARGALFLGLIGVVMAACGSGLLPAIGLTGLLAVLMGLSFAEAPVAAERVLRGGLVALVLSLGLGAVIAKMTGVLALDGRYRAGLVVITVLTLLSRCAFLHTEAFYPDYRVHALVQQTLDRVGLPAFLDQLFEIQYARSLGLQQIGGNWYPFPYPPGAYVLTHGVGIVSGLDPLDAALVTAAAAGALIPLLTLALGVSLGLGPMAGLLGAAYVSLQPLLVRRMALGYFPGLAGQLMDALALLCLLAALRRGANSIGRSVFLALCLLVAFLVYTQSIANFGLLLAGLLAIEIARPSPGGRAGVARAGLGAALALLASGGAFYSRYVSVLDNVENHRPQPESRVLERLEQLREKAAFATDEAEADDRNDPYAGATLNPLRGIARLASRLWRFNGPFVLLVGIGWWLLLKQSERSIQNVVVAWSAVALAISVLAAGLPSPNGFQHLKDLEFVSPLVALAMAFGTLRLWSRRPLLAGVLTVGWVAFAMVAFLGEWTERLLQLGGS